MSTRSGKRIHSEFFENMDAVDSGVATKLEKKTRNKRFKENYEHQDAAAGTKSKKQRHYVGYPTDDENGYVTATDAAEGAKSSRKTKKNTLKEQDINVLDSDNIDAQEEEQKTARVTRQTRKFTDIDDEQVKAVEESLPNVKVKSKKNKKKKSKNADLNENELKPVENVGIEVAKKSKKKKKGKSKKISTEDVKPALNKSNVSTDSFHSAAGSPVTVVGDMDVDIIDDRMDTTLVSQSEPIISNSCKKDTNKKIKSSLLPTTPEKEINEQEIERTSDQDLKKSKKSSLKNITDEKETPNEEVIRTTEKDIGKKKRASSKTNNEKEDVAITSNDLNSTYDKIDIDEDNTNSDSIPKARRSLRLNDSAIENRVDMADKDTSDKINTTFEKDTKSRRSIRSNNSTDNGKDVSSALNTTYEKSDKSLSKAISLDSTFEKSATKMNSTFDKIESNIDSGKSSLISSDNDAVNITFDKDSSRISITSDESNNINTSPVLIESSLDESQVLASKSSKPDVPKDTAPLTPLKREGTFTKEGPEVINKTPTKRQSLPSPGFTPFHVTRSSNKDKSVLNVTRSIEKPACRTSLANIAPARQTRVMFYSPVNNPVVVVQQKKKVIKSSMKGSNKSFVLDDMAPPVRCPSARKRSYTHDDAADTRAKRKRLADDLQLSVDRLSRPRTSSAAAKLPETTPSRKAPTPSKPKTEPKRTRLPNFAALHQKQFDKMESLTECQQRKMTRARKLLVPKTPNGTVVVLERSSPRGTAASPKPKNSIKKSETPAKAETSKTPVAKLPTLESLRPGFTRFGFKMHTEFNPFSIPSKTETKPKTTDKQNGVAVKPFAPKPAALTAAKLTRQPMLPSLNGITTTRKEAARQAVMREKSLTLLSKRDAKRNECRTIIKGVRTNRRFELQMKMRNVD